MPQARRVLEEGKSDMRHSFLYSTFMNYDNESIKHFFDTQGISFDGWYNYDENEEFTLAEQLIPNMYVEYFERRLDEQTEATAGVHYFNEEVTLIAWGFRGCELCSYHIFKQKDGTWSAPITGCPDWKPLLKNTEAVGFTLTVDGVEHHFE